MLIPISTDAPLYHYPISTVGLIVVNLLCFAIAGSDNDAWMLHYGTWKPLEWLSSIFAHADIVHLLGNMFFLWAFGLIVEGKLGWGRFLLLYLAIGVGQSGIEQTLMLGQTVSNGLQTHFNVNSVEELAQLIAADDPDLSPEEALKEAQHLAELTKGGSCGASAAIFGLLAICLVWAPKNEFHIIMFIGFRMVSFDTTIMWYSLWYIGWEAVMFSLGGFNIGSAALHLMGALVGFGGGVLFLKKGWVDCENWDLFRVLSGKYGRFADPSTDVGSHANPMMMFGKEDVSVKDNIPRVTKAQKKSRQLDAINGLVDSGDFMTASEKMFELRLVDDQSQLNEQRLKKMCLGLMKAGMPDDAEIYLEEFVDRFPETCDWARVRMAQLLLTHRKRPAAALQALKKVRLAELPVEQQDAAKKLAGAAKKQVQAGVQDQETEW